MKKKMLALGLALTLTLSLPPAMAAGAADKFPAKNTYTGFSDVASNHWALANIKTCYETGLMNGKGAGFDPDGSVTQAEAMVVAARVGAALRGDTIPKTAGSTWYGDAVAYLKALPNGAKVLASENLDQKNVSRYGLCLYLSVAVPEDALVMKNSITALPDIDDADVLRFYNAGILTGVNGYGTFAGGNGLKRVEMAAMLSRITRPETALSFTPQEVDVYDVNLDIVDYYGGVKGTAPAIVGKDASVSLSDFIVYYMDAVNVLVDLCKKQGVKFSWDLSFTDGTTFRDTAKSDATGYCLRDFWETTQGQSFASNEQMAAKHILVDSEELARSLRDSLTVMGDSRVEFNYIMAKYSTDPGLKSNPDGYTFGPGEMIPEFENTVKALKVGEISQPVKSQFGWHIIMRTLPQNDETINQAYTVWWDSQEFYYSDEIGSIDLPGIYDSIMADQ